MGEPTAGDGIGWNRFDGAMLYLVPPFMGYVGAKVGHEGTETWILAACGFVGGVAVLRGIEFAIRAAEARDGLPRTDPP